MSERALLYVTGMGMVASLGLDAATCCAAARAGLSRAQPWPGYPVMTAEGEDMGVVCHMAPLLTSGFEGQVRLRRLLGMAVHDLMRQAPWLPGIKRAACYLAVPEAWARMDEAARHAAAQTMWREAALQAGWREPASMRLVVGCGHTGFARALEQAAVDLSAGTVDVAITGGLDTLIDTETLSRLEGAGRLKTPSAPAGLQPGEAAALVLIEREDAMRARGGQASVVLRGLAFGHEPHPAQGELPPTGRGMAEALHTVVRGIHFAHQLPLWCVSDHTGEVYRAMDWGHAQVQVEAHRKARIIGETVYAAASFGDTGAASGAVALCLASTAFQRRYASGPIAALLSAGDSGDRAVVLCQAA